MFAVITNSPIESYLWYFWQPQCNPQSKKQQKRRKSNPIAKEQTFIGKIVEFLSRK
jgi:hypothetical protein